MELADLTTQQAAVREEVAHIFSPASPGPCLRTRPCSAGEAELPEYGGNVWELHPIVAREASRRRGLGRALVAAFRAEVASRGALTMTLGTDDDAGITSLADAELYADIPRHIAELRDLGRNHPFLFYRKLGFVVTGGMPDAKWSRSARHLHVEAGLS